VRVVVHVHHFVGATVGAVVHHLPQHKVRLVHILLERHGVVLGGREEGREGGKEGGRDGKREGGRYLAGAQEVVFPCFSQLGLKVVHVHLEHAHVVLHHVRHLGEEER
jgi:hypothetical protein